MYFHGDVYIVSTFCLIGVCYVRCLKGGVNPLSNCQFKVSLCNTKFHVGFLMAINPIIMLSSLLVKKDSHQNS